MKIEIIYFIVGKTLIIEVKRGNLKAIKVALKNLTKFVEKLI